MENRRENTFVGPRLQCQFRFFGYLRQGFWSFPKSFCFCSIAFFCHHDFGRGSLQKSFFREWQAVGVRCFISFDHHTHSHILKDD